MKRFNRNFGKHDNSVYLRICLLAYLLISVVFFSTAAQALTIGNYDLVARERVERTEFNYTYRAEITNDGPAMTNVTGTVQSTAPNTGVVDGLVSFGEVPANATVRSEDTFMIRQDRRFPLDLAALVWVIQSTPVSMLTTIQTSPSNGEGSVAITRETVIRFSRPIADAVTVDDAVFAEFGGERLVTRTHISPGRRTLTLFYPELLPASARIRVTVDGDALADDTGLAVDADGDGQEGGVGTIDFDTLSLTVVPGTIVCGRVFASELGDNGMNLPLPGVTITVDGAEDTLNTTTNALGHFRLEPAPAGRFFVHIDGRSSTREIPEGAYYPFVGKAWESEPGEEVMVGNIYLPLVIPETLQDVSEVEDTEIAFPGDVVADYPELAAVKLMVPADALYSDDGARGGKVGIAPVDPDRLPGERPEDLNFPIVITVQTDGATNFDQPVPVCFPNLPAPATGQVLAPGAKSALWSFNHDTGRFEIVGSMTVSGDGDSF